MGKLTGKTALITGASKGIGEASPHPFSSTEQVILACPGRPP